MMMVKEGKSDHQRVNDHCIDDDENLWKKNLISVSQKKRKFCIFFFLCLTRIEKKDMKRIIIIIMVIK